MNEDELTYGETIKQPFPKLEDIKITDGNFLEIQMEEWLSDIIRTLSSNSTLDFIQLEDQYHTAKQAYENGVEVTWQLKQTDPHAEIKAEYEKAIADGKIVKVLAKMPGDLEYKDYGKLRWSTEIKYELRYYNIDWNKLLSWSYANGKFVECELLRSTTKAVLSSGAFTELISNRARVGGFIADISNCRLAKGVEIKDEWLKEVK